MKRNLLLALWLTLAYTMPFYAQFTPEKLLAGYGNKNNINCFDFTGDGLKDIFIASNGGLLALDQLTNNNFDKERLIRERGNLLEVADMNNDGELDLVTTAGDSILILNINGDGTLSIAQVVTDDFQYKIGMFLHDIDLDGDLDIFIQTSFLGFDLYWFENKGTTWGTDKKIGSVEVFDIGDMNGDGYVDVITNGRYYENEGDNSFDLQFFAYPSFSNARGVELHDIDLDNDLDLVMSYNNVDTIFWYENDGDANFTTKHTLWVTTNTPRLMQFSDLNGDNRPDLILDSLSTKSIYWLSRDANNKFGNPQTISRDHMNTVKFRISDLNQDGHQDILLVTTSGAQAYTYLNDGNGEFEETIIINSIINPEMSLAADLDGDNRKDLVVYGDYRLVWMQNKGSTFGKVNDLATFEVGGGDEPNYLATGDFNQDGIDEIIGGTSDHLAIYKKTNENSIERTFIEQGTTVRDPRTVDFDGDGDIDITAIIFQPEARVVWYENDGAGNFGVAKTIGTGFLFRATATDLDQDGDMDLVAFTQSPGEMFWLENTGNEIFSDKKTISVLDFPQYVLEAHDLDQDGDIDILYTDRSPNSTLEEDINWIENLGNNNFSAPILITDRSDEPEEVAIGDFNNDGFLDLVYPDRSTDVNEIVTLLNDGNQNFEEIPLIADVWGTRTVALFDMSLDGDWDIVSGEFTFSEVFWFENVANNPSVSGEIYWDENANKVKDSDEIGLDHFEIVLDPAATLGYTTPEGTYRFYLDNGPYSITPMIDSCWILTTDSISYHVSLTGTESVDGFDFGVQLADETDTIVTTFVELFSGLTRCNTTVPYWLFVENISCQPTAGSVALVLSELIDFADASPTPSNQSGDTLWWDYVDLSPNESFQVKMNFELGGLDNLGDFIAMEAINFIDDSMNGLVKNDGYEYQSIILCAFDPNDKLVRPDRTLEYDENYTLFEEVLDYTVRFQNTGNDTAFNVVIRDQLSNDLDWSTFRPGASSHIYDATLDDSGLLTFRFNQILLPDSTTNFEGSQGFVNFTIHSKTDLSENTLIENTAGIYFDFNPPIITNTTQNVLVTTLPTSTPTVDLLLKPSTVTVFPNPFNQDLQVLIEGYHADKTYHFEIRNITGQLIESYILKSESNIIKIKENLATGIYIYQVKYQGEERIIGNGKVVKISK